MKDSLLPPHGGCGLINRLVPEVEIESLIQKARGYKSYTISNADLSVFFRIADGTLSPLEGPMEKKEFNQVLEKSVIKRNGKKYAWTIPLAFPISKKDAEQLKVGETVAVKTEEGVIAGILEISDIYPFEKEKYNKSVYGTDRTDHPGARIFNDDPRDYLLGGKIWAFKETKHPLYGKYVLGPEEARKLFQERKWERIVAFQTRNPLHRAHEYAMVYALEKLTKEGSFAGVVLNPLVGQLKSDDVPAEIRMRTYEALLDNKILGQGDTDSDFWKTKDYELMDHVALVGLDMKMFYAGPKEAVMHGIYRQNLGFTDLIIGRKHADAPFDDGSPIWGDFDAQEIFHKLHGDLVIKPVKVGFAAYYEELGRVALVDEYKDKGYKTVSIAGKELRKKLQNGEPIDERVMRKPVADILADFYQRRAADIKSHVKSTNITWHETVITKQNREEVNKHRGAVIWMTGLSACGKSTIAVELQSLLFARGLHVYILDGDNIRHGLNKNLGFSPEDREENIRRIGEVAKLFADAGFLVISSFISPYRKDRDTARALLAEGDFVEVFVKASVEACEKRDPKGLYKKARAGVIKEFTGISAPYEEPVKPEILIDTETMTSDASAQMVFDWLEKHNYIHDR